MVVAKALNKLSTLKLLNIRNNSITEEATDAIASIISGSSILEQLYLAGSVESVRLLRFWPDRFFLKVKAKFHFCKRQVINKVLV